MSCHRICFNWPLRARTVVVQIIGERSASCAELIGRNALGSLRIRLSSPKAFFTMILMLLEARRRKSSVVGSMVRYTQVRGAYLTTAGLEVGLV